MMKCEDVDIAVLLDADEEHLHSGDDLVEIAAHVESCEGCQRRLSELAADEGQWKELQTCLSPGELSADAYAESLDACQRWKRPTSWTESMARSLLSPPSHPEMLGRLGRYDIERLIGSGGMGVVFKAYDTELNRPVAVKLLAPYLAVNGAARKRFAREARAAAAVVDDHVVPIHNVESNGTEVPFLVMQYIPGGSLQQRLDRQGPPGLAEILRIGLQTARGLAAAHAQGLIHRDVKPSNILLDEGVERALLTDFGLARADDDACLTRSGFHPGTPHYMSPEQVRGEAIDQRCDLFSLGCVLYALCTGHPPFRADTSYAVLRRITDDTPRSIREVNSNIPEWLEAIVMKLLAKSRANRFESAEQVASLLERCLSHVQQPTNTPLPADAAKLLPQRGGPPSFGKWLAGAAAAFVMILAGVLMVLETNKGTLTIESAADDVPIRIKQGDKTVRKLTVSREGATTRLSAGRYTIEIGGANANYEITGGKVIVRRGEIEIAKVTYTEVAGRESVPLTEERMLADARREFNYLHSMDGKGRPQTPLMTSEIRARLAWKMGNGELSEEVLAAIQPILYTRKRLIPAGWQFSGGLVRSRCEYGIVQTWDIHLETNGLSQPILIRRTPLAPPSSLRTPSQTLDENIESIPLATAISEFNVAQEKRIESESDSYALLDEPSPLTLDEVLAGIAYWQVQRDEAEVDDATFQRLQDIATTHRLPSDVSIELIPTVGNAIGQRFNVSSIRVLVPRVDKPESTYAFTIRQQFLELERTSPLATFWGAPGRNGIQAGFRLLPSQKTYDHDQVVEIEFLFRSFTGKEVLSTLPGTFRYRRLRAQYRRIDLQGPNVGKDIYLAISDEPTVVKAKSLQFCMDENESIKEGAGTKLIVEPGKHTRLQFVVSNPGDDAADEELVTGWSHYFDTPHVTPPKVLPLFVGHWYRHWGMGVPGHRRPDKSTPDPEYIDPFRIGASLGPADKSRIPAYYASGLQVTKVARRSPAEAVGMEVGDILLSWKGHQIIGDDPSEDFFKYRTPTNQLKEVLEKLEKSKGWGSYSMEFDMLDHRTGEVIRISPWGGFSAGGSSTKTKLIERALVRKHLRESQQKK